MSIAGTGVPPVVCSQCGTAAAPEDLVTLWNQPVCAACKPAFVRRMQEGNPAAATGLRYKGFWIRFVARLLDSLVLGVVVWPLYMIVLLPIFRQIAAAPAANPQALTAMLLGAYLRLGAFVFVLTIAYFTFFHGKFGATLGKMAIHAKVVNSDGSPITYGKAFGRCFGFILSYSILYIGLIMAAFDQQKRGLHDRICATRVVAA